MKKTNDCALTQLAIECIIGAYGIRCANKKSHHAVRDAAIKEIVNTLHWYQMLCEVADSKDNLQVYKKFDNECQRNKNVC